MAITQKKNVYSQTHMYPYIYVHINTFTLFNSEHESISCYEIPTRCVICDSITL